MSFGFSYRKLGVIFFTMLCCLISSVDACAQYNYWQRLHGRTAELRYKMRRAMIEAGDRLNLKTNALYDLALVVPHYGWAPTPNFSVEFMPEKGDWTGVFEYSFANWRNDGRMKTWIVRNYLFEGRRYIPTKRGWHPRVPYGQPRSHVGHYVSGYFHFFRYDIQLGPSDGTISRYIPRNWGLGVGYGYIRRINKSRFKWEVGLLLGFVHSRYDTYHASENWAEPGKYFYDWHSDPSAFDRYAKRLNYVGPTRIHGGITIDLYSH